MFAKLLEFWYAILGTKKEINWYQFGYEAAYDGHSRAYVELYDSAEALCGYDDYFEDIS